MNIVSNESSSLFFVNVTSLQLTPLKGKLFECEGCHAY